MPVHVHYITVARQPLKVTDSLISYHSRFRSRFDSALVVPVLILQRCRPGDYPWPDESLITVSASLEPASKAQGRFQFVLQSDSFVDAARCHPSDHRNINITEGIPSFTILGQIRSAMRKNSDFDLIHLQVLPWMGSQKTIWVTIKTSEVDGAALVLSSLIKRQVQVTGTLGAPRSGGELCVKALSASYLDDRQSWLPLLSSGIARDEWPEFQTAINVPNTIHHGSEAEAELAPPTKRRRIRRNSFSEREGHGLEASSSRLNRETSPTPFFDLSLSSPIRSSRRKRSAETNEDH